MRALPQFVPADIQVITQELVAAYEAMTGKTLYPGQIERLLINLIAYRETLVRTAINDTGRQNLVAFARAPMLDYLGELVGVNRLPVQSARDTVRLTFSEPLASALPIPVGFRVETATGVQFQTEVEILVAAGSVTIDLSVVAVVPGAGGNGYLAGQVNAMVDDLGIDVDSVANLAITSGGTDEESDDRLRERIKLAPESFSVAGSRLAYRHHAMAAHQDIVDVAVLSPVPGVVHLYPLTQSGLPSAVIQDLVVAACSDEKVRPLTDTVEVLPPVEFAYSLSARLTVYRGQDAAIVLASAQAQAAAFVAAQAAALGRDIVPSQIIAVLSIPGVYRVDLLLPAATLEVGDAGWANCTAIDVQLTGSSDG